MTDNMAAEMAAEMANEVTIHRGLSEHLRDQAASIFDEAFSEKLKWAIPSRDERLKFLAASFCAAHALTAVAGDALVGIAGLSAEGTYRGGLLADTSSAQELRSLLGTWGAIRAGTVLSMGEHKPSRGELYIDGFAVAGSARSQGIGTRMLDEIATLGHEGGFDWVRLEVIDINDRAQQLYERRGYRVTKVQSLGFIRRIVGFGGVVTMELALSATGDSAV